MVLVLKLFGNKSASPDFFFRPMFSSFPSILAPHPSNSLILTECKTVKKGKKKRKEKAIADGITIDLPAKHM